jgi:hypothetical protein
MKKWLKWLISIIGIFVVVIIVYVAWNWTKINIVSGTEELSGESSGIPEVVGVGTDSLQFGESDWISWYGPDGDRIAREKDLQTDWSKGLNKIWEVDFLCQGSGSASWSAPVIQGNRLVVCGRDTGQDLILCLNPNDGTLIWYQSYVAKTKKTHGSGPRATPYIDGERVYTFGRGGDLGCWRLFDGEALWRKNVTDEGGESPTWGYSSSPLVIGNLVLVQGGGDCRTIAYDKITGDVVWKSGSGFAGYAALSKIDIDGNQTVLAFHGTGLAAVTADEGTELWNENWTTRYNVNATSPVVTGNRVFITSGYGTGSKLLEVKSDRADSLWRSEAFSSHHSDPYIIDGYIYGYSGNSFQNKGSFKCIDLTNGEEKWSTNDIGWGTCVLVDGYLLCSDIKGNIALVKPNPSEFILVTELSSALGDIRGPVWTTPVVSNGHLYLRFKEKLICYNIAG